MNVRAFLLLVVLLVFSVYSLYVIGSTGIVGFFQQELSTAPGVQVFVDLVIACMLGLIWMRGDAASRGLPFAPYAVLTLCLGSIGLLSYLLHRELKAHRTSESRRVATA